MGRRGERRRGELRPRDCEMKMEGTGGTRGDGGPGQDKDAIYQLRGMNTPVPETLLAHLEGFRSI